MKNRNEKCIHNIVKSNCIQCNPQLGCIHNKLRRECSICTPNLKCIHDKRKKTCNICKPELICEHNINKINCRLCNIQLECIHKHIKNKCLQCRPELKCEHNITKNHCVQCRPELKCIHNINKFSCINCNPQLKCIHNITKNKCLICNPELKCKHNIGKQDCPKCNTNIACKLCKYTNIKHSSYKPFCSGCYYYLNPNLECFRQYKLKENLMVDEIKKKFPNLNITYDRRIYSKCSSNKRPDIRIELYTCSIILECDEFQHKRESKECELKRMQLIYEDLGNRPIIFIRFNPDNYINKKGVKIRSCFTKDKKLNKSEWKKRIKLLLERVNYYIIHQPELEIEYLFYNEI